MRWLEKCVVSTSLLSESWTFIKFRFQMQWIGTDLVGRSGTSSDTHMDVISSGQVLQVLQICFALAGSARSAIFNVGAAKWVRDSSVLATCLAAPSPPPLEDCASRVYLRMGAWQLLECLCCAHKEWNTGYRNTGLGSTAQMDCALESWRSSNFHTDG